MVIQYSFNGQLEYVYMYTHCCKVKLLNCFLQEKNK